MNEVPRNFRPKNEIEVSEGVSHKILYDISMLRQLASNHKDFEVEMKFSDEIAHFSDRLHETYTDDEIRQVPLYHHLFGSGMPIDYVPNNPIPPKMKLAIEKGIVEFVEDKLKPLLLVEPA